MASEATTYEQAEAGLPFPLQDSERVLAMVRRHWVFLWPRTLLYLGFAILPPLIISLLMSWAGVYEGVAAQVFWLIAAIWLLYWAVRIFLNWYRYNHDVWVITNQRIVDSIKSNPFSHQLSTADLVNVQDMTVNRSGILATLLNYGDIICETASDSRDFVLSGIPRPQDVQLLVDRERDRERRGGR
jgi:hypothetical protein